MKMKTLYILILALSIFSASADDGQDIVSTDTSVPDCSTDTDCEPFFTHCSCSWTCKPISDSPRPDCAMACQTFADPELSKPDCVCTNGACEIATDCTDSDGGQNYYVKGTTCDGSGISSNSDEHNCEVDQCMHPECVDCKDQVLEFYCNNGNVNRETVDCDNGCFDGACRQKCAKEGEYTSGTVSPQYAYHCCEGLKGFNTHPPDWIGGGLLCYDPDKGTPVCKHVGTKSEGWYYSRTGDLLIYENCGDAEFRLTVSTDKTIYRLGDTVTVTASVSGDSGVENAEVTASVTGEQEIAQLIKLEDRQCVTMVTDAAVSNDQVGSSQSYERTTCYFKGTYVPREEGDYRVTATAKLDNTIETEYTKFSVGKEPSGQYVRLNEKFTLKEGASAKVTDFNYMKITLGEIRGICSDETAVSSTDIAPSQCFSTAIVMVSIPNLMTAHDMVEGSGGGAGSVATRFELREGASKEAFGAKITLLDFTDNEEAAVFIVNKAESRDLVDIDITPREQEISYRERAVYKVTVRDKNPIPTCPQPEIGEVACSFAAPQYSISVRNLPFSKQYDREITVRPGGSTSFELIVSPYQVAEVEPDSGVEIVTGNAITKTAADAPAAQKTGSSAPSGVTSSQPITIRPVPNTRRYKFSVTAQSKYDSSVQDTASAVLIIKPETPTPPPFPNDRVSIKLYKGWNLVSLPGKLVRFDNEGLGNKLVGFVWLKDEQKYVSLKEAERLMGDTLREYLMKNAFWIYTKTPATLNVFIDTAVTSSDLHLVAGWNLVPITEDMLGGYLADVMGDCDLDKLYMWFAKSQEWEQISLRYSFSDSQYGYGFLVKANYNCRLNGPEILPPPMPGGEQ